MPERISHGVAAEESDAAPIRRWLVCNTDPTVETLSASGSWTGASIMWRLLRCATLLFLLLLMLSGCGGGLLQPQNAAPRIVNASVIPDQLTFRGGTVVMRATARDDEEVVRVTARVASGETNEVVELAREDGAWTAEWTAPPNATEAVVDYTVTFLAFDAEDRASARMQRTLVIGAADADSLPNPPSPPPPAPPEEEA